MSEEAAELQTDLMKGMILLEAIEMKIGELSPADDAILSLQRETMTIVNEAIREQENDENYSASIKLTIALRLNKIIEKYLTT